MQAKRKVKAVYFGDGEDQKMLQHANSKINFSEWVKVRLREEMEGKYIKQTIRDLIKEELGNIEKISSKEILVSLDDLDQFY